jgi:hypothetical protein
MRTVDDLRAAFAALEQDAPDPDAVRARVQVDDAAGRRPPRRLLTAVAAAAVVAVSVPAAFAVLHLHGGANGAPAAGSEGLASSLDVAAVSRLTFTSGTVGQGVEQRDIRTAGGSTIGIVEVGGSFLVDDGSALTARQPITVSGHRAILGRLRLHPSGTVTGRPRTGEWISTVPAVAWPDGSGRWVVVRAAPTEFGPVPAAVVRAWGTDVENRLRAVADAVDTRSGRALPVPFRLEDPSAKLTPLAVGSDTDAGRASGRAVIAENGLEVTIEVGVARTSPATGTRVRVGGHDGRIATRCAVQPAPTAGRAASHADCQLTYSTGRWHVAVFVTGPGGGPTITPRLFVALAEHLRLAADPGDVGTWFAADGFVVTRR